MFSLLYSACDVVGWLYVRNDQRNTEYLDVVIILNFEMGYWSVPFLLSFSVDQTQEVPISSL
jgi:hypothetical protein